MSYMALYRKWRPSEFEDVKGQEHIVKTLRNQIIHDRVGHAYLFCGTRGTGKTTIAKLFAKAVNCENPVEGSPCGECAMCKAIASQSSLNVIEIDAASNNGVDNIREIRDEVNYSPTEGKYKVYIIDEVHMLSPGAFNALLKTLEEPPSYVIFILATTEAHKIPITILSRCQRYDFRRITIDTISDRLQELMEKEKIEVEEKAIRYVAKAADGSLRDALSLLDQCIAFHLGETLTYDMVLEVLGVVDVEQFQNLVEAMEERNTKKVLERIDNIVWQGKELGQFVLDFTWYLRNLLMLKVADGKEELLEVSKEKQEVMFEMSKKLSEEDLMRYIRILSELSGEMRYSANKRVLLEVAMIKMCIPKMEQDFSSIMQRLKDLEKQMEQLEKEPKVVVKEVRTEEPSGMKEEEVKEELIKHYEPAKIEDLKLFVSKWETIKQKVESRLLKSRLQDVGIGIASADHTLNLLYYADDPNADSYWGSKDSDVLQRRIKELEDVVKEIVGKEIKFQCIPVSNQESRSIEYIDMTKVKYLKIDVEN